MQTTFLTDNIRNRLELILLQLLREKKRPDLQEAIEELLWPTPIVAGPVCGPTPIVAREDSDPGA